MAAKHRHSPATKTRARSPSGRVFGYQGGEARGRKLADGRALGRGSPAYAYRPRPGCRERTSTEEPELGQSLGAASLKTGSRRRRPADDRG
jgi:hypothetical protein